MLYKNESLIPGVSPLIMAQLCQPRRHCPETPGYRSTPWSTYLPSKLSPREETPSQRANIYLPVDN